MYWWLRETRSWCKCAKLSAEWYMMIKTHLSEVLHFWTSLFTSVQIDFTTTDQTFDELLFRGYISNDSVNWIGCLCVFARMRTHYLHIYCSWWIFSHKHTHTHTCTTVLYVCVCVMCMVCIHLITDACNRKIIFRRSFHSLLHSPLHTYTLILFLLSSAFALCCVSSSSFWSFFLPLLLLLHFFLSFDLSSLEFLLLSFFSWFTIRAYIHTCIWACVCSCVYSASV